MMVHWRLLLIERVFVDISIVIMLIGYHVIGDRRNMRGEVGWSLSWLDIIQWCFTKI